MAALGARVAQGGERADLVIRTGGAGEAAILAAGLALAPGETTALGRDREDVPVLALPVIESDAIGAALALLPDAIGRLAGAPLAQAVGRLAEGLSSRGGIAEVALLAQGPAGLVPVAVGDTPLAALARAQGWCVVPADGEGFAPGTSIAYFPLP